MPYVVTIPGHDAGNELMTQVELYGQNHSPWVQAVLLGVHLKQIPYTLVTAPPLAVFRQWGVMMPAARIDGAPWQLESADILRTLGFSEVSAEDRRAVNKAWMGVLHRADKPFRFFNEFSKAGDGHSSFHVRAARNFCRSFASFYFFTLMTYLMRSGQVNDPADFGEQFLYWEDRLATGGTTYLSGEEPDTLDLLLFGIVQCHASIEVPPLNALKQDARLDRLRLWITAMQVRFSDYPHLYSGQYFQPHLPAPSSAGLVERGTFWAGVVTMIALFPLSLSVVWYLAGRVRRG